jgi:hypothetical protein
VKAFVRGAAASESGAAEIDAAMQERRERIVEQNLKLFSPQHRAAEQEKAAQAQAEKRKQLPPAREVMREVHDGYIEAVGEVDRLTTALGRAKAHQDTVAAERASLAETIDQAEAAAAKLLIDRLGRGGSGPCDEVADAAGELRVKLADLEHDVAVATRAVDTLAGELAAARKAEGMAQTAVHRAVGRLLLDHAVVSADRQLAMERELVAGRDELDALAQAITDLQRHDVVKPIWPPQIAHAINPPEPLRAGRADEADVRRWAELIRQLTRDPNHAPDLDG